MRPLNWLAAIVVAITLVGSVASSQSLPSAISGDMRHFENEASFTLFVSAATVPSAQHDALEESLTAYLLERATILGFPLQDRFHADPYIRARLYVQLNAASGGAGTVLLVASTNTRDLLPSGDLVRFQGWVDLRVFTWENAAEYERAAKAAANEMLEGFAVSWRQRQ